MTIATVLMFLVGLIAPWSMVWIKEQDSGWNNKQMLPFILHTMLCVIASYVLGYMQAAGRL